MGGNYSKTHTVNGKYIDPNEVLDTRQYDDPDGVGRIVRYRDSGYDIGYDVQPVTGHDAKTRGEKGPSKVVQVYSESNLQGEIYEIEYGNYTSEVLIPVLSPHNVFSLTIPPKTTVKLYAGNEYDFGGKGGVSLTNISQDIMRVNDLPANIAGQVRSMSIVSHSINRAGLISSDDETETVITTERGDVIRSGMSEGFSRSGRTEGCMSEGFSSMNITPGMVIMFYILLLVFIMFLIRD